MHALTIDGVQVLFPFEPYELQINYMSSVIKCLKQKSNGLLESSTGTGKTLCLLCAALGWLDSLQTAYMKQQLDKRIKLENVDQTQQIDGMSLPTNGFGLDPQLPKILYSSRTHSQLSQACKELKNSAYTSFKAVVIGSRDQLCLHPDVTKLESNWAKNQACKAKINVGGCSWYKGYEGKIDKASHSSQVFDIEDLVSSGKQMKFCPYYAARHISNRAALVFTPYNYILDPLIRRSNGLELKNSIVIFDEGHNIERNCEESVSAELRSDTFSLCIKHLDYVLKTLKEIDNKTYEGLDAKEYDQLEIGEIARAKIMICDLETAIDSLIQKSSSKKTYHDTRVIFDIMQKSGFEGTTSTQVVETLVKVGQVLNCTKPNTTANINAIMAAMDALTNFIDKLIPIHSTTFEAFKSYKQDFIKKFKVYSERGVEEDSKSNFWAKKTDPNSWVLYLWCMSPSIGVKALVDTGIHSMIITSGTLTPIDSFDVEMETNFPIKLQNSHIISGNQLAVFNMSNAKDGTILTSKYDNRDNVKYMQALGQTLIDVMAVVPKGMLVFFSSYTSLNKCIDVWKGSSNLWHKMNGVKQIFLEPRSKNTFIDCIEKYKMKIDEIGSHGAAFFAVCRGKLSEGIDLPDHYCRCVIMTGLPFPPVADPKVILKKQYLSEARTRLTPDGWYTLQMKRALNQSIGRVVRHKDDFGVIILMDSRFAFMREGLSKWIEKFIHKNRGKSYGDYIRELDEFFTKSCPEFVRKFELKKEFTSQSLQTSKSSRPSGIFSAVKKTKLNDNNIKNQQMIEVMKSEYSAKIETKNSFQSVRKTNYKSPDNSKNTWFIEKVKPKIEKGISKSSQSVFDCF